MKNRVLFLPTRYFPSISGAEFYLQRMAEILSKNYDYEVDIFTSNAIDFKALRNPKGKTIDKKDKYYNTVNNLKINRFPIKYDVLKEDQQKVIKNIDEYKFLDLSDDCLQALLENGPYMPDLIEYFSRSANSDYKLIHATFFPYFNLIISLILGKRLDIPVVVTPFFHFSNPRYLEPALIEVLTKFDLIIACTNIEKRIIMNKTGISGEKIKVIPMGVDIEKFGNATKSKAIAYSFKEKYFEEKEKKYKMILYCGYKNYEKGALSVLKSIPHVLEKMKKVYFVLIGPTTMAYNRELSKIKKINNVRIINLTPDNLTGYFDKKKIAAFKETDLYLMPSRSDAFGIAFLEAWAAGKPVIGANIGATPHVINNNVDGFLVEFDNPKDISEKVVKLLKSKRLRRSFGAAGKEKVRIKHTWELIAEKTHDTYQHLINTRD